MCFVSGPFPLSPAAVSPEASEASWRVRRGTQVQRVVPLLEPSLGRVQVVDLVHGRPGGASVTTLDSGMSAGWRGSPGCGVRLAAKGG